MSPRTWQARVEDILDAIAEIQQFTHDMDFDTFRNDAKTIKAVQLDFIVIGEATSHIPEAVRAARRDVPWHLIRDMRNRLVHVYFDVDPQIVWETIKNDLAPLAAAFTKLLKEGTDRPEPADA